MRPSHLELLPELLELLVFGLGSVLLSAAGVYIERFALLTAEGGQLALGAWVALMGIMAFYFAYLTVTERFRPRFVRFVRTVTGP
ncbi:hypothetical protein [Salinigranum halophilum]|jgi:hypothetical protein|uniref:hypothetical protein n=1 Tax=Salinigranum halophilum TaxID=2565931 RepID=UPI0010A76953|nr:hypothetical protein [Salinigranum halophilum]